MENKKIIDWSIIKNSLENNWPESDPKVTDAELSETAIGMAGDIDNWIIENLNKPDSINLGKLGWTTDSTQEEKQLAKPEIRVWCHPHYENISGEDYYKTFNSFRDAFNFIASNKVAEKIPLLAFGGKEINLFIE